MEGILLVRVRGVLRRMVVVVVGLSGHPQPQPMTAKPPISLIVLLMMKNNFMCKSAHIENLDESAKNMNILREIKQGQFNTAMSNSFGFGGTNASLIFKRYN